MENLNSHTHNLIQTLELEQILKNPSVKFLEVLDFNQDRCFFTILGQIYNSEKQEEEKFVIKLKKKEFTINEEKNLDSEEFMKNIIILLSSPVQVFNNDIYYKLVTTDLFENKLKIDLIFPADYKVIDKYRKKGHILFKETSHIYHDVTLKFIESIDVSHLQWIKNILYKGAEELLYEEKDHFVICQDYNSKDNSKILNCLGIPYLESIKSIRDLNESHLDLLEKFYFKGKESLAKIFNIHPDEIRCFIHYPPSFYYFHVHYLQVDLESNSTSVNRAIDLYSIIQNIKLKGDYYQTIDLEMTLLKGSKLHELLINRKYI
jgi:m7GpppX diphosphatase